ncbi:12815_t:CDS:2 [Ambispora gerdemannii]|uniref:12815_t:CDS:1 n=1 Tax=Ambispora gerdemannii TaxID=144530 RepID=A0A9N8Z150_9GLOM|nr:12815_t:CDS:2 [Ambispora gerdemannii]
MPDVRARKTLMSHEDKKLQKSAIWGERKFVRTVVRLGMLLHGMHGKAPANIIDEAIDEALITREEVIRRNVESNTNRQGKNVNRQGLSANRQEFFEIHVEPFLCYLHNPSMFAAYHHNPVTILDNGGRCVSWVYETRKQLRETQADSSVRAVSIDPGVRTSFTWYSPTKGVGKIGESY